VRDDDRADRAVAHAVGRVLGDSATRVAGLGGGDINRALRVEVESGATVFVKYHAAAGGPPPGMFAAEARGLAWLAAAEAIRVPRVLAVDETWLALEWLEPGRRGGDAARLGRELAQLHAAGAPAFGLDHDNFIAVLPQDNTPCADAAELWIERRLRPMVARAAARGQARPAWPAQLDRLRARWSEIAGPDEPPARLHGDLWSGNVHADGDAPALVDPAAYGGPREIDLAMLALFGGLSPTTRAAYEEVAPLAPGWRERVALWQLYPLLVHAVLFGGGYGAQVDAGLARYA
jgi:fructosamine-3-kinase